METSTLPDDNHQALVDLAKSTNELLEGASQASAYRAFNLGCMIGIFPALLLGLVAYLTSQYSWIAAVTTTLIMLIAVMGFAGLAAYLTRARRMDRIFHEQVYPEITNRLAELDVNMPEFQGIAAEELASNAALVHLLSENERSQ
jgi:hypothetical protein